MADIDADVEAVQQIAEVPAILETASAMTGCRLTLVARVTRERWMACAVYDRQGMEIAPGHVIDSASSFCSTVREDQCPLVVEKISTDPRFSGHPASFAFGLKSYIGVPIYRESSEYFGTLCALDAKPLDLSDPNLLKMLELFGRVISLQLQVQGFGGVQRDLVAAKVDAGLREQFIAVLGHDLRNPLAAVTYGAALLQKMRVGAPEPEVAVIKRIQSSAVRMSRLIDDVVDFAQGRLGGGISINRRSVEYLPDLLQQVITEVASSHPDRSVILSCEECGPATLDRGRFSQVISNLVGNALHHSPQGSPVDVKLRCDEGTIEVSVLNLGAPIPQNVRDGLFKPFVRGKGEGHEGLGLGLYIAAEIVRAHGGNLDVQSTAEAGTIFTVRIPRVSAAELLLP